LLHQPAAAVPLRKAFCWGELACRALGTEHLGLHVARATSIEDLGAYGGVLAQALTLFQYIRQGIALYGTVVVGQRFWLSAHGGQVRLNLGGSSDPGLGSYQSALNSFAITIANMRRFAGPNWVPTEISFGFRPRESIPTTDLFEGARVLYRPGPNYIEFPCALLGQQLRHTARMSAAGPPAAPRPLPRDLPGLVELQIESLLSGRTAPVDLVAETLGVSTRSLQRGLAAQGASYTDLLTAVRIRRAAEWLEHTDKPVVEIAFELGYTDASNFTRAFRRQTGVPPKAFRAAAGRH
jgi:AraC-like DNA-binding protein